MESTEELKEKLKIATQIEYIQRKLKDFNCPICGGKLEYKITEPKDFNSIQDLATGIIKCPHCNLLKKEIQWDVMKSYHWNSSGASELEMLRELYDSIYPFLKK